MQALRRLMPFVLLLSSLSIQGRQFDIKLDDILAECKLLEKHGHLDSSIALLRITFKQAIVSRKPHLALAIQEALVLQLEQAGRKDELQAEAEKLHALALQHDHRSAEALSLLILSRIRLTGTQFMEAMESCRRGLMIGDSLGDVRLQAIGRFFLGEFFYKYYNDADYPLPLFQEALADFTRIADTAFMIRAYVALARGEPDEERRRDYLVRSLALAEGFGSMSLKMRVLANLALFEPPQEALKRLEEGLAISQALQSPDWTRRFCLQLSHCYKMLRQYDQALDCLNKAFLIGPEKNAVNEVYKNYSHYSEMGDRARAVWYLEAFNPKKDGGDIGENAQLPSELENRREVAASRKKDAFYVYGLLLALLTVLLGAASYFLYRSYLSNEPKTNLAAEVPVATPPDVESEWVLALQAIVQRRLGEYDLKAEDIAQDLNMSRTQFFRQIKKNLNMSPAEYLEDARFQRAQRLLESGEVDSVKAAAYEVGFKQVRYFSRLYKQRFGISPSESLKNRN